MAPPMKSDSHLVNGEVQHLKQEGDTFISALKLVNTLVFPMTLNSAIDLGIFDVMAKEGEGAKLSAKDIAAKLRSENPEAPAMLDRILRLLASHSVVCCSVAEDNQVEMLYSLTPMASQYFVADAQGVSLGAVMKLIHDKVFLESWSELKGAVMEGGIPFNRAHGMHAFEYPSKELRFNKVFNNAMFSSTNIIMKKVLETYKGFENVNKLVDVGGGVGVNLHLITSKYPHIQGINFDLPHVIQHAPPYSGIEHVGGDMFKSVPQGDAIFMKWILHDWSDEHCIKLLKNCYDAIPDDGKVIIVDFNLPIVPETSMAAQTAYQADLLMMTQHIGGKERTKQEFLELAITAGFGDVKFVSHIGGTWIMEFLK
ncbi:hypothetical protein L6164_013327 [Bauhinia variegata]|uniref:Uncharacterized protein n=1 Tax=Bauhinia variegata TaxID=167791 RepID=A0ACB9PCN7_BAUVA|nr:hypothetical protein L6164_013327 [Bauhinia variegata]